MRSLRVAIQVKLAGLRVCSLKLIKDVAGKDHPGLVWGALRQAVLLHGLGPLSAAWLTWQVFGEESWSAVTPKPCQDVPKESPLGGIFHSRREMARLKSVQSQLPDFHQDVPGKPSVKQLQIEASPPPPNLLPPSLSLSLSVSLSLSRSLRQQG